MINLQDIDAFQYQKNKRPTQKICRRPKHFSEEDIQMANEHMKRCTTLVIIQFSSVAQSCLTVCNPMDCSMPGFPVPELIQTHVHRVSDAIQPSHPLSSPSPAFNLSQHRSFQKKSVLRIRWPKYWSFSFNISASSAYSGLISFRLNLLAVQGTLKSLLQYHSSKPSVLWCSAFFIVQLSHLYMTTGKTIALTRWTFVGKAKSLFFNILSRLVKEAPRFFQGASIF